MQPSQSESWLGYPSLPEIDWDGDFDSACSLVGPTEGAWTYDVTNSDYSKTGGSAVIEQNLVGQGFCAARFTNSPSLTMTRSELQRWATRSNPTFVYEVLFYVPLDQIFSVTAHTEILQHKMPKDANGTDCYNGGLRMEPGAERLSLVTVFRCTKPQVDGQQAFALGPIIRNRWFAVKVYFKAGDSSSTGAVRAWVDADGPGPEVYEEKVPLTGVDNQHWDGQSVLLRVGQYRQASPYENTVLADGFHLDCLATC